MFGQMERMKQAKQIVDDPTESELVQAAVDIIVTLEYRQLRAVEGLHDALGSDGIDVQAAEEERKQQLFGLVDAMANQRLKAWWFEDVVADNLENETDAMAYAGLAKDDWEAQKQTWADTWRDRGGEEFAEHTDEDLARLHVERKFGVSLREFENEVVGWTRQGAMRNIVAGNFEGVEQAIRSATDHVQDDEADDGGEDSE